MKLGRYLGRTLAVRQTDTRTHMAASASVCICDPELLAADVSDVRCPTHGLDAFLRASLHRQKDNA